MTVSDGHAFVADTYNGVFVVDVSKPDSPRVFAHRQLPVVESRGVHSFVGGLAVGDDWIFVAGGYSDLHVVGAPEIAKSPVPEVDNAPIIGSPPVTSREREGWRIFRPGDSQVHGVDFLTDDRAVVACGNGGVRVVELWPEIREVSQIETGGFATDVSVNGSRVHVAEGAGGMGVYEVDASGSTLNAVGRFRHGRHAIRQVEVPGDGRFALLQAGANRFLIVDIEDPAGPELALDEARHGLLYGDQMMRGLVDDRYTCVFWHVSGLHWYDLKASPLPAFSGSQYAERIGSSNGLTVFENRTLATVRGGFRILDHQRLAAPHSSPAIAIEGLRAHPGAPTVAVDRLYAAHRASGRVTVVDISNPSAPRLVEEIETPGNPARVVFRNGSLIIANGYDGLLVRDPQ